MDNVAYEGIQICNNFNQPKDKSFCKYSHDAKLYKNLNMDDTNVQNQQHHQANQGVSSHHIINDYVPWTY